MNLSSFHQSKYQYKYLIFFSVFYFMGWVVSYPVVYKLIYIHHILESASTLLYPISYAVADIIAEVYGYKIARQVIWAGIVCGFIFSLLLELISYIPTVNFLHFHNSYQVVLGHIFRVYLSITVASVVGSFMNIYIISKFKVILRGRLFWLRSLFSTAIGELIFTILGGIMVWGGVESWPKITLIMLNAYVFKMIYALIALWPTVLIASFLKRAEHTDVYDVGINYNPFKLNVN